MRRCTMAWDARFRDAPGGHASCSRASSGRGAGVAVGGASQGRPGRGAPAPNERADRRAPVREAADHPALRRRHAGCRDPDPAGARQRLRIADRRSFCRGSILRQGRLRPVTCRCIACFASLRSTRAGPWQHGQPHDRRRCRHVRLPGGRAHMAKAVLADFDVAADRLLCPEYGELPRPGHFGGRADPDGAGPVPDCDRPDTDPSFRAVLPRQAEALPTTVSDEVRDLARGVRTVVGGGPPKGPARKVRPWPCPSPFRRNGSAGASPRGGRPPR